MEFYDKEIQCSLPEENKFQTTSHVQQLENSSDVIDESESDSDGHCSDEEWLDPFQIERIYMFNDPQQYWYTKQVLKVAIH
jgi:hypothetical protein